MTNHHKTSGIKLLSLAAVLVAAAVPVWAATPVAYVAYTGSDTNACTRLAQCKTITHALTVVSAGGVVDITASGSYDTFTVTKAVSVEADLGVAATITVPSGGTGITVNGGASDTVTLKRLSVWGSAGKGVGIQANSAATVVLEDCVSRNLQYGAALTSTSAYFKVAGGVFEGSDTSIIIRASTNNVAIDGVKIYGTSSNAAVDAVGDHITVSRSLLAGSGSTGFNPGVWVKGGYTVVLENDVISGYSPGVQVSGGTGNGGEVYLSNNTIINNVTGVVVGTGIAFTRSNNTIAANSINVNGSLTPFAAE
jgi:hypothetical protein